MDRNKLTSAVLGYTYEELDNSEEKGEIHLLAFASNRPSLSDGEPLSCSITTCSLYDAPPYSAISYAWGDARIRRPIEIDGLDVEIPAQAEEALRSLPSAQLNTVQQHGENNMPYLWIDALCINQSNNIERSQQVAIMSEIYACAQQVLVFLGQPFDGHLETMKAITAAATQLRAQYRTITSLSATLEFDAELPDIAIPAALTKERTFAFYSSRWFTRLWVLQEVALSRMAVAFYGNDSIVLMDARIDGAAVSTLLEMT